MSAIARAETVDEKPSLSPSFNETVVLSLPTDFMSGRKKVPSNALTGSFIRIKIFSDLLAFGHNYVIVVSDTSIIKRRVLIS